MPSLHIAMACWLALTLRGAGPRFQWIGWLYFALIWVSSVHLGWHYVSDGLVGSAGALLMWRAVGAIQFTDSKLDPQRALATEI
jgi:membrane-associated phospholipid phosphatase